MAATKLGVFSVERCWKLYSDGGGETRTFADRASAVAAGAQVAREEMAWGRSVELHFQDAKGEFHMADLNSLAH